MFRTKQTIQPMMDGIKNAPIPVIRPPRTGMGAMPASVNVLPMRDVFKKQPKLFGAATDYSSHRTITPCVKLGINILRSPPVDGLNQQAFQGIARHQLKGMQYALQNIPHPLNGKIMPQASNFNAAFNSKLGMVN
tara:strand:+ start:734 stop:1138 length:405 start_codon:yes stop_codon:yes gene_type:complete